MAFKMKGSSLYGKINLNRGGQANKPDGRAKSSAFQASVPTKEESKQKAISELNKIHNEQDKAEDKGDALTANIYHTAGRKKLAEGRKLYGKKKGAPMKKEGAPMKDLSGDGKITQKDVLIGRGVIKKPKAGAPMKKSPMEKAGGFDDVVEGFKTIGRTLKPSVKNVKKAGSDIKEGFRQLFTGDRTDSRIKKKKGAPMKKEGALVNKRRSDVRVAQLKKLTKRLKDEKIRTHKRKTGQKVEDSKGPIIPNRPKKKKGAPKLDDSGGQGGKKTKYKNTTTYKTDDKTTAETTRSKKNLAQKIFGGKTTKKTTTSRGAEDVRYTRSSEKTREDRKGRTRKKVTVGPKGKKTVTRYKKDGTVKSVKAKKGTHKADHNKILKRREQRAIDAADYPNRFK